MFTLRCTTRLLKRIRVKPDEAPPPATTRLGDWYAHLAKVGRRQVYLCVSERTLLPVVLDPVGSAGLPDALANVLQTVLRELGVPVPRVAEELSRMSDWAYARTASRTVVGSMIDFAYLLQAPGTEQEPLTALSRWLASVPCRPLGMGNPRDAALEAFGA